MTDRAGRPQRLGDLLRRDAEGRAPPPPRRLAPDRDRDRAGADPRRRRPARPAPGWRRALIAPMPCRDQAELLPRVRPADRADAGRRGARADHRRARRGQGGRRRPLRRDPLGAAAPRRPRAARSRTGSPPCARARARPAARTGTTVRLICTALRSHDPEANVRLGRDRGGLPRPRPDRLGPGRAGGRLPGPAHPRAPRSKRRARGRPADHHPRRGVGRRSAGSPGARRRARADRARPRRGRRPGALSRADRPRRDPRPLPDLQRPGRHRAVRRGASAGPAPPRRACR